MLEDSEEDLITEDHSEEEGIPLLASSQQTTTHRKPRKRLTPQVSFRFLCL